MLVTEEIIINSKRYVHNYSDAGFYINKVGTTEMYEDAIDLPDSGFQYIETDNYIEVKQDEQNPDN